MSNLIVNNSESPHFNHTPSNVVITHSPFPQSSATSPAIALPAHQNIISDYELAVQSFFLSKTHHLQTVDSMLAFARAAHSQYQKSKETEKPLLCLVVDCLDAWNESLYELSISYYSNTTQNNTTTNNNDTTPPYHQGHQYDTQHQHPRIQPYIQYLYPNLYNTVKSYLYALLSTPSNQQLTQHSLFKIYQHSLLFLGSMSLLLHQFERALGSFQKLLQLCPYQSEALYSTGLAYNYLQRTQLAEEYWLLTLESYPMYWDAIDQLQELYCHQKRPRDSISLLIKLTSKIPLDSVKKYPYQWWKYLSLHHSLGDLYSSLEMYYEAAMAFCNLLALALKNEPISADQLGISQSANKLKNGNNQDNPSFISELIHDIGKAVKESEIYITEAKPANEFDQTHLIFQAYCTQHTSSTDTYSDLFIISPRHALICKYFMFPPYGKVPIKAKTQGWIKYLNDIQKSNGIKPAPNNTPQQTTTTTTSTPTTSTPNPNIPTSIPNTKINQKAILVVQSNSIDLIVSNALLHLAKIFQDGISSGIPSRILYVDGKVPSNNEILALYMLSLSLHPNPSTANNIGILMCSLSTPATTEQNGTSTQSNELTPTKPLKTHLYSITMQYYNFGLLLDQRNTYIYTNLGSLYREQGKHKLAIQMYTKAVECEPKFNIALTNLAATWRDEGQIDWSIFYYRKAVESSPDFIEAVSGLANSRSSVCDWKGRGGYGWEKISVDESGALVHGHLYGWISKVAKIVDDQIESATKWGVGVLENEINNYNKCRRSGNSTALFSSTIEQISRAIDGYNYDLVLNSGGDSDKSDSMAIKRKKIETRQNNWMQVWKMWQNSRDEGTKIVQLIESAMKKSQHRWYMDRLRGSNFERDFLHDQSDDDNSSFKKCAALFYPRPKIPAGLPVPLATTILPFHAFTLPFSARQVYQITQRASIRISVSSLLQGWLPDYVFPPPPPPKPITLDSKHRLTPQDPNWEEDDDVGRLVVGYVSSDIVDHPLAHLMQSVFGFHDRKRFHIICYATTPSDGSEYRKKVERETETFKDVSKWSSERLVNEILHDGVHILVNLNGFTRGARNDLFAVRPCPIQISLIGFAGSLGGGWCDYLLGDKHSIGYPEDFDKEEWVYKEHIIYMPRSFFCCDHRQSALDSNAQRSKRLKEPANENESAGRKRFKFIQDTTDNAVKSTTHGVAVDGNQIVNKPLPQTPSISSTTKKTTMSDSDRELLLDKIIQTPGELTWETETVVRKEIRQILFPNIPPDAIILGNLNQLYKIDPTTFKAWLDVLTAVPNAYLWLLQFPKSGEDHLRSTALRWTMGNHSVVDRIIFTPVAEKHRHILRARACDLFVDTPECNAHTTAADVVWTGTPIITYPRYSYKMCSRVACSIISAALPNTEEGHKMAEQLIVKSDEEYQKRIIYFAGTQEGRNRLEHIRHTLFNEREVGDFFDTKQWVKHVERGYRKAWKNWVDGKVEHIYL